MANQLGTNPWVIDTPGAAVLFSTDVKSAHFEWTNYTATTDVCVVKDRFGKIIWSVTADSDLGLVESYKIHWVHGIAVTSLTSGVLRVYFE